jgi:hypothetical protein
VLRCIGSVYRQNNRCHSQQEEQRKEKAKDSHSLSKHHPAAFVSKQEKSHAALLKRNVAEPQR